MNSRISTVSKVKIKMEIHSGFSKFVVVLVATLTFSTQNNVSAFTPGMNSRISTVTTSTTSLSMRPTKTKTDKKESFQFKELGMSLVPEADGEERWEDVSKKIELIGLGVWWATTDLTTQGTALKAVNDMYDDSLKAKKGQETEVPKVVTDRHFSNVVSCFFILMLYSVMVLKPGTLFPFPWDA